MHVDNEYDEEDQSDPLINLGNVLNKMRHWLRQPTIMEMVTKPSYDKLKRYFVMFQEQLIMARE